MKTFKGIGVQLVLSFVVAICVSIILVSLGSLNKTRTAINGNTKVTSEQTLEAAQGRVYNVFKDSFTAS